MISCEDLPENAAYATALGAADFVPKPIDFGRLKSSVDAALERRNESRFGRRAGDATRANDDAEVPGLLLLADRDNRADAVSALTSSRFRLFETNDPGWAAETVRKEKLDAVLAQMDKDAGPAEQLLVSLREEEPGTLRLPVIAITDPDPDRILDALKAGADDYLSLPIDPRILAAKVEAHVRYRREHERKLSEATAKAVMDAITGLYTAAHFKARLNEELHRSLRYKRDLALAVLRVSTLARRGVLSGMERRDGVLLEISRVLRSGLRSSDLVGRWGEEEFALILPETSAERVTPRMEAIRTRVNERLAECMGGQADRVCSIGLASLPPASPGCVRAPVSSAQDFLAMANTALTRARLSETRKVAVFGA